MPRLLASEDATFDISPAMYCKCNNNHSLKCARLTNKTDDFPGSVIETNIGILAASIPSFNPLFKRYMPHLIGDYSSSSKINSTGNKLDTKGRLNTNTEASRAGFMELDERNTQDPDALELDDMYKVDKVRNVNTNISSGKYGSSFLTTPNSSEERVSVLLPFDLSVFQISSKATRTDPQFPRLYLPKV